MLQQGPSVLLELLWSVGGPGGGGDKIGCEDCALGTARARCGWISFRPVQFVPSYTWLLESPPYLSYFCQNEALVERSVNVLIP